MNSNYAAGGSVRSIHDERTPKDLKDEVLAYRKTLDENKSDPDAWLNYAVSLSDFHWMNREAANAVGMAIALSPFNAEYHFFRGYCHQKLGLLAEAAADLEMAWKLDPNHQNAGYYLGQTYFYMGEYERGSVAFDRVMQISPPDAEWSAICNWQYLMLRKLGRDADAKRVIARITADTQPAVATGTLGNTWTDCQYLLSCQAYNGYITPEEAIERAKPFGTLNHWYVIMYMAIFCDMNGDAERALRFYQETVDRFDDINRTESTKMTYIIEPRIKALKK